MARQYWTAGNGVLLRCDCGNVGPLVLRLTCIAHAGHAAGLSGSEMVSADKYTLIPKP